MAAKDAPAPDIMNVREIIEYAFGDFDSNSINFKLVETVLLLIARQLRILERRVEVELDNLKVLRPKNTLSVTEVKIHASQKKGKQAKTKYGGPQSKPGEGTSTGAGGGTDAATGVGARTKGKKTGRGPQSTGSDKTSTDKTSTDKTTSSTDKTSTDKTTTSTDKTSTDKTPSEDRVSANIASRTSSQKRADSKAEGTKSPTPMASVTSLPKPYETLLVVKKVSSKESRASDTGRTPQISVVTQEQFEEVATAVRQLEKRFLPPGMPGFPEHAELMEELRKGASLTDAMAALQLSARLEATEKLLSQLIGIVTELAQVSGVETESKDQFLFSTMTMGQPSQKDDGSVTPSTPKMGAGRQPSSVRGAVKSTKSIIKRDLPATSTLIESSRVDTARSSIAPTSRMGVTQGGEDETDEESGGAFVTFNDLRKATQDLRIVLIEKLKAETARTTSTAESAFHLSTNLVGAGWASLRREAKKTLAADDLDAFMSYWPEKAAQREEWKVMGETFAQQWDYKERKLDQAQLVTSRMTDLENVVKQYADQINALDTGLSSQMTSYQEQLTQMQHDLEIGLDTMSEVLANSGGDVEAIAELHNNFTNFQIDCESIAFRQKELKDIQNSIAYDLENLWKEIEMLRDTKSDREEVADALRDKAGISELNGLVALQHFEAVRGDFEKRIAAAYDTFNNQENIWQKSIEEMIKALNEKADLLQVQSLKNDINKYLNMFKERIQIIQDIVGEPKSAILNKKVFRDTTCISCGTPAHMDFVEVNKVPALPKFPSAREPAEGAEAETKIKGAGDTKLCFPDMPIPHVRDPRSYICKRYCGGSHTLITDGLNKPLPGLTVQPANRTIHTALGTDGKLYMVDEQPTKLPCLPCNVPTPQTPATPEPESAKRALIDSIDECGGISLTPPALDVSYHDLA